MDAHTFLKNLSQEVHFLIQHNKLVGGACYLRFKGNRHFLPLGTLSGSCIDEAVRADTLYDLASLSKVVGTTTAIMRIIEMGMIGLKTPVHEILPRFQFPDIHVFHLLSHSSGLPSDLSQKYGVTRHQMIDSLYNTTLAYKTGSSVLYSDIGYILLGFIVDQLTEGLRPFLKSQIFERLSMNDTDYCPSDISRCAPTAEKGPRGRILGEVNDTKAYVLGGQCGSAGLFSTLADCAKFADALLEKPSSVLSDQSIDSLFNAAVHYDKGQRTLGWELFKRFSGDWIYHSGFTGTCMLLNRESDTAFVFLSNAVYADRDKTMMMEYRKNWLEEIMRLT